MNNFHHAQKGRSILGFLYTVVALVLCLGFLLTGNLLFQILGLGLLILVISGLYSILKGEKWEFGVKDTQFFWRYPRWPKSSGTIDLETVNVVEIDDNLGWISFHITNHAPTRIRLFSGARQLNDFLRSRFPALKVDFIENN